jgi:hypothetical protein
MESIQPNMGILPLILIFGTGFVAAVLWGLSCLISALRGDGGDAAQLRDHVAALEHRVASLEQAVAAVARTNASNAG